VRFCTIVAATNEAISSSTGKLNTTASRLYSRNFRLVRTSFKGITLGQSFEAVGPVQWDGKYVAVGDDVAQKIYRFAISSSSGTLKGTVDLGSGEVVTSGGSMARELSDRTGI
jgi:hypothetical protein